MIQLSKVCALQFRTRGYPNLSSVRGVQEESRGRRGVDMGKYHLRSGGQAPPCIPGPRCLYVNSATNFL